MSMPYPSNHVQPISVCDFGAVGDDRTLNTTYFQAAIDAVSTSGGGTLMVPRGRYRTGTLFIRSLVTLELAPDATLVGSTNLADYPALDYDPAETKRHLIIIQSAHRAGLSGTGTIDGSAAAFCQPPDGPDAWIAPNPERPSAMVAIIDSQDIAIRDVRLTNPPNWVSDIYRCDRVRISGITIINDGRWPNNDGIDISGSSDVIISDCHIDTGDDGIVLNTRPRATRRVLVSNCTIRSQCAALKIGWEFTKYDISQIAFTNCILSGSNRGLAAYSCNGAVIEDIVISNIVHDSNNPTMFSRPIHLDLRRSRDTGTFGSIRNLSISNFLSRTQGRCLLTSEDGGWLENISIRDLNLTYPYIEDPDPIADGALSSQFSNPCREARRARAAIVAQNIRGFSVNGLTAKWPTQPIPIDWRIPVKRENGGTRLFRPNYETSRPTDFSLLWARNVSGIFQAPLAQASGESTPRLDLVNCNNLQTDRQVG